MKIEDIEVGKRYYYRFWGNIRGGKCMIKADESAVLAYGVLHAGDIREVMAANIIGRYTPWWQFWNWGKK